MTQNPRTNYLKIAQYTNLSRRDPETKKKKTSKMKVARTGIDSIKRTAVVALCVQLFVLATTTTGAMPLPSGNLVQLDDNQDIGSFVVIADSNSVGGDRFYASVEIRFQNQ